VLGIVAGVLFTFLGLPPILHHFFGETHVAVGETYEGDAKAIRVTDLGIGGSPPGQEVTSPRVAYVSLTVRTNKTWVPAPSDFKLELPNGDRVKANNPAKGVTDSALDFDLGVERTLTLMFDLPARGEVVPRYLHISDPPVRFDLPPATSRLSSQLDADADAVQSGGRTFSLESWSDYEAGRDGHTRFVSVMLWVRSDIDWQASTSDFVLQFEDGRPLTAVAPEEKIAVMGLLFWAGQPRRFNVLFECPADQKSRPKALHIANPRVDFAIPPAKLR
jgi:hypothetical protein